MARHPDCVSRPKGTRRLPHQAGVMLSGPVTGLGHHDQPLNERLVRILEHAAGPSAKIDSYGRPVAPTGAPNAVGANAYLLVMADSPKVELSLHPADTLGRELPLWPLPARLLLDLQRTRARRVRRALGPSDRPRGGGAPQGLGPLLGLARARADRVVRATERSSIATSRIAAAHMRSRAPGSR
jgi:hypothetical protein